MVFRGQLAKSVKGESGVGRTDDRQPPAKVATPSMAQKQKGQAPSKPAEVETDKSDKSDKIDKANKSTPAGLMTGGSTSDLSLRLEVEKSTGRRT